MEKGTVNLPIEEYDRLKQIERDMVLLCDQSTETVLIEEPGSFRLRFVYKASDYIKGILNSNASLQRELKKLKNDIFEQDEKRIPWYKRLFF